MSKAIAILGLVILLILILVFFPLAVIWALNTLFSLGLDYSLSNWAAILILGSFFNGQVPRKG